MGPLESITRCRLYPLRSQFRIFGSRQGSPRRLIVDAMYQNSNNTPPPHCCQQLVSVVVYLFIELSLDWRSCIQETYPHRAIAASWARSSRSPGVDCTCCDRSFASSAVARDRRAACSLDAMYQNSNNTPPPHCCQQLVTSRRIVVGVQLLTLFGSSSSRWASVKPRR